MADPMTHPLPYASWETRGWWEGAGRGEVVLQRCTSCGLVQHKPRAVCVKCLTDTIEHFVASGKGTIYSYSVMRRAPVPYAVAYVTLAEGPRMVTNIVDCDFDKLKVEQAVKVVFKATDGGPPLPMFTPA